MKKLPISKNFEYQKKILNHKFLSIYESNKKRSNLDPAKLEI